MKKVWGNIQKVLWVTLLDFIAVNLFYYTGKDQAVFIVDKDVTSEQREKIKATIGNIEIKDYTDVLRNTTGTVPVTGLLENIKFSFSLMFDGQEKIYYNGEGTIKDLHTGYMVMGIKSDKLTVELVKDDRMAYLRRHVNDI